MADMFRYTCEEPARLIFANIVTKSAPPNVPDAKPNYSATFGITEKDFENIRKHMVDAIKSTIGSFSGNPADYYLPCLSGKAMADRTMQTAELNARGLDPDKAFKIREKAEKNADLYRQYPAILRAATQFEVSLARLDAGKIIDIGEAEHLRVQAGKDYFYRGAWVAPAIAIKGTKRKKLDDKDGCTAFLQNVLFIRRGEPLGGGGSPDNNKVFGNYAGYSSVDPTALAPGGAEQESAEAAW